MTLDEHLPSRISIRAALLVLGATFGLIAGVAVSVVAVSRSASTTTTWVGIAVAALSAAALIPVLVLRPEIRRVARSEQAAALRRIKSYLRFRAPVDRRVLTSAQLDIRDPHGGQSESMTIEIFMSKGELFPHQVTLISGPRGSGKSTLLSRLAAEVAEQTYAGRGSYWPLFASALSWSSGTHFSRWVERDMYRQFRIRRRVTGDWISARHKILFVDDLDELESEESRERLLRSLQGWQSKPFRGKLVMAVGESDFDLVERFLKVDRVAMIRPIAHRQMLELFRRILTSSDVFSGLSSDKGRLAHQLKLLRSLADDDSDVTNSILRALEKSAGAGDEYLFAAPSGEQQLLRDADYLLSTTDNYARAIAEYLQVASMSSAEVSAIALMRASLVQAALGRTAEAASGLDKALEQFKDLNPLELKDGIAPLDEIERAILDAMSGTRPLLESEIAARSGIEPSAVKARLESLLLKGFAFTREVGSARTPFYESAFNRRSDAIGPNEASKHRPESVAS